MLTITPPIQFLSVLLGHHRQHLKTIKNVLQSLLCPIIKSEFFCHLLTLQDKQNICTLLENIKSIYTRCDTGDKSSLKVRFSTESQYKEIL
jgi:hypothetical protein